MDKIDKKIVEIERETLSHLEELLYNAKVNDIDIKANEVELMNTDKVGYDVYINVYLSEETLLGVFLYKEIIHTIPSSIKHKLANTEGVKGIKLKEFKIIG